MDDAEVLARIAELVDEEHALERTGMDAAITDEAKERLASLEVALDQCWDLLRQRRARRDAGQDPDAAQVRPEGVVEDYRQ